MIRQAGGRRPAAGARLTIAATVLWLPAMLPAEEPDPPVYPDHADLLVAADGSGKLQPVRSAAEFEQRRRHILAGMQQAMGPLPERFRAVPLDPTTLEEVRLERFTRRKVEFGAEPADRVTAWLLIPRGLKGKAAAVLCLHQTNEIGKDEPAGLGGGADLHYAAELAERGFVTLAPDCWDFGAYRKKDYDPYDHGYVSGTMKTIWNGVRSLDYLISLPEVDAARIGCIGHSLGGHNALWLAAFDGRVRAVVSSCGFSSFASYAASKYGGGDLKNWAQKRYMPRIASVYANDPKRVPFDWPEVLGAIAPRPVFVSAPIRDENFLAAGVDACIRAALPVYKLMGAEDHLVALHPDAEHGFPSVVREAAYAFLERHLRGETGSGKGKGSEGPR